MAVSELPGNPNAVWTVRLNKSGKKCSQYCTSMPRVIVEELRVSTQHNLCSKIPVVMMM
jgi:hypothetical protein